MRHADDTRHESPRCATTHASLPRAPVMRSYCQSDVNGCVTREFYTCELIDAQS